MVTLTDLPAELIQQIHLLSLNPFLPLTSLSLYRTLHHPPSSYAAQYLLTLYRVYGADEILVRALRHPVCGVGVVQDLVRRWDRERGYVAPSADVEDGEEHQGSVEEVRGNARARKDGVAGGERSARARSRSRSRSRSPSSRPLSPLPPPPTATALTCFELPRRLFREPPPTSSSSSSSHPSSQHHPHSASFPLVQYLFEHFSPSPNSHKGYPLCRAVLTSNYPLVTYLLEQGADPSLKDCLAVEIAISYKDLGMIKLLVERDAPEPTSDAHTPLTITNTKGKGKGPANSASWLKNSVGTPITSGTGTGCVGPSSSPSTPKTSSSPTTSTTSAKKQKLGDRLTLPRRMVEVAMKKGSKEIINYFVYDKKIMPPLQSIMKLGLPAPAPAPDPRSSPTPPRQTKVKTHKASRDIQSNHKRRRQSLAM